MASTDTTVVSRPTSPAPSVRTSPAATLARQSFRDARTRTVAFAYIFALYSWLQAAGYHHTYPTLADRVAFARAFAGNNAIRLFYGYPYHVVTIGGYSAWRVGGTLAIAAAAFGVLAAVRALRAEEDAGRTEIVLAGTISRRAAFTAAMAAIAAGTAILWLAEFAGFLLGGLSPGGSAYLAVATCSVIPVFVGIGAVISQVAPTRRTALGLGSATVAVSWLLRVLSDTMTGAAWLRWATPLGWAEELRPYAHAQPAVLLLSVASTLALLFIAVRVAATRDIGTGLLPANDTAEPSTFLLSSPTAQALRRQGAVLAMWTFGVVAFATILGMISTSISSAGLSTNIQKELAKLGSGSIITPTGYLSFVFIVFIFAICLFVCSQTGAARQEEADQQLETLLALPASRTRWLGGRLIVAALAAAVLSLLSGLLTWVGAASQGLNISLPKMLQAGANCLPVSLLFLGASALVYSLAPRASSAISYTLVAVTFVWYLVGAVLGAPRWLIDLTPFQHIGLVPAQHFRVTAAAIMVAIGLASAVTSLALFRRRDLLAS